jgi:hypothetical protein
MSKRYKDDADKQRAYRERKKIMLMYVTLDDDQQEHVDRIVTQFYEVNQHKRGKRNA